jgi:hypothetical protein
MHPAQYFSVLTYGAECQVLNHMDSSNEIFEDVTKFTR